MARVLVIDDDDSVRELLRILCEQAGHSVISFSDGRVALNHLEREQVDVIVLDLMMPALDGWTIARTVQADVQLRRIPVVVFSALVAEAPEGVAAVLEKPSDISRVVAVVGRVLGHERRRAPRYPARFVVTTALAGTAHQTTTRDVSTGGVSFCLADPLRVGERLTAAMDLSADGVAEVELEVRHVVARDGSWHVGARFVAFRNNERGFAAALARIAPPPA